MIDSTEISDCFQFYIDPRFKYCIMIPCQNIIKRTLSTVKRRDIGQVFFEENVQKLLKDITRYDESKLFARRAVPRMKTPKLMFMTEEQLEKAKQEAYEHVKARLQMPPVLAPDTSKPEVISRDDEIIGYTKFKVMFIDITPGYSNRNRLMSVREPDGTLRFPTHIERSRMNNIFYPSNETSIDVPKLFEEANLLKVLKRGDYVYILNRACVQFEPDDPLYVETTSRVYNYVDEKGHYDKLRSTRHFGPMSLYLAYNKRADSLILEMISKNLIDDAAKLVKIFYTCHEIEYNEDDENLKILRDYIDSYSSRKHNLELAIQNLENKQPNQKEPTQ